MFKVKTKFRLLSSLHMLIPVMIVVFFTRNTPFFFDTAFQIALTICLGLILFNTMFSPFLFGLQWLFFKQIRQIVSLCSDIKHGRYRYFIIPNEPVETGDENELISLMRSMNWMVHQIERREELLERQVAKRTRELENINAELTVARDAAKASSNAKGQFLATMSHEIRTPMNAIIGMSDLILKAGISPQINEYATIINTSSKDLLKIINDILDFSKIDAGKLDIEVVPMNLRDLLEEVADIFKHSLAQKSVELITDIHENVPRQIKTDPLRLKQVMINLVSNAVKFTHEGEILIRVTTRNQENGAGFYLEFSIHDTGIGMDQQALDHLFHAFTQADGSTSRKFGGTGLGLAISKNLVALMGGQISVASTRGKGSCFSFTIHTRNAEAADLTDIDTQFSLICCTAERIRKKTDKRPGDAGSDPGQELSDQVGDMMEKMGHLLKKNSLNAKVHAASLSKELEGTVFASDAGTLTLQIKRFDFPSARKTFQHLETAIRTHRA